MLLDSAVAVVAVRCCRPVLLEVGDMKLKPSPERKTKAKPNTRVGRMPHDL